MYVCGEVMDKRRYIERNFLLQQSNITIFQREKGDFIVQRGTLTQVTYMNRGKRKNKTEIAVREEKQ
jgi:hypothetical protein